MELLYRFEGTVREAAPIGLFATGMRIDIPFEGRLVAGQLGGGRAYGTEYLLQRRDGVGAIDARDTFEVPGGFVHAQAHGFVTPPPGIDSPPLETMLEPGFEPPDLPLVINGFALCQTGVPEYEHLNRTLVKIDGWVNNGTGELMFEGRAVAPVDQRDRRAAAIAASETTMTNMPANTLR